MGLLELHIGWLGVVLDIQASPVTSYDSVAVISIKLLSAEGGVGEPEERRRTGGGGFPVYWSPISFLLGRPSRAFGGTGHPACGYHHGLM